MKKKSINKIIASVKGCKAENPVVINRNGKFGELCPSELQKLAYHMSRFEFAYNNEEVIIGEKNMKGIVESGKRWGVIQGIYHPEISYNFLICYYENKVKYHFYYNSDTFTMPE